LTGSLNRKGIFIGEQRLGQTIESKNKALVLEAFDTLFNKRDYEAAKRYWSPDYIQHSAHIPPGRDLLGPWRDETILCASLAETGWCLASRYTPTSFSAPQTRA
jgi:hypothetical protein